MKDAIRIMRKHIWLLLAVVMLLFTSCEKMISSKMIGNWRVVKQEWSYWWVTDPVPFDASLDVVIEFQQDGKLMYTDMNGNPNYHFAGEWYIHGNNVCLKFNAPSKNIYSGNYSITELKKKSMVLSYLSGEIPLIDDSPLKIFLEK